MLLAARLAIAVWSLVAGGSSVIAGTLKITEQPQSLIVASGETTEFSVAVTSDLPVSFQWRFNEKKLVSATNSTLWLTNVQPARAGNYSVLVANSGLTNERKPERRLGSALGGPINFF